MRVAAEALGLSAVTINRYENGRGNFIKYAAYLGVDISNELRNLAHCPHCGGWLYLGDCSS